MQGAARRPAEVHRQLLMHGSKLFWFLKKIETDLEQTGVSRVDHCRKRVMNFRYREPWEPLNAAQIPLKGILGLRNKAKDTGEGK